MKKYSKKVWAWMAVSYIYIYIYSICALTEVVDIELTTSVIRFIELLSIVVNKYGVITVIVISLLLYDFTKENKKYLYMNVLITLVVGTILLITYGAQIGHTIGY